MYIVCASDFYSFTADVCTANPNATAYTDCSARSSSLYYRAERELLPLPSVLLMRASVCASPPVEAPHGPPSCQDLENKK